MSYVLIIYYKEDDRANDLVKRLPQNFCNDYKEIKISDDLRKTEQQIRGSLKPNCHCACIVGNPENPCFPKKEFYNMLHENGLNVNIFCLYKRNAAAPRKEEACEEDYKNIDVWYVGDKNYSEIFNAMLILMLNAERSQYCISHGWGSFDYTYAEVGLDAYALADCLKNYDRSMRIRKTLKLQNEDFDAKSISKIIEDAASKYMEKQLISDLKNLPKYNRGGAVPKRKSRDKLHDVLKAVFGEHESECLPELFFKEEAQIKDEINRFPEKYININEIMKQFPISAFGSLDVTNGLYEKLREKKGEIDDDWKTTANSRRKCLERDYSIKAFNNYNESWKKSITRMISKIFWSFISDQLNPHKPGQIGRKAQEQYKKYTEFEQNGIGKAYEYNLRLECSAGIDVSNEYSPVTDWYTTEPKDIECPENSCVFNDIGDKKCNIINQYVNSQTQNRNDMKCNESSFNIFILSHPDFQNKDSYSIDASTFKNIHLIGADSMGGEYVLVINIRKGKCLK